MVQKPIVQYLSITAAIMVIALLLLPGIAAVLEGDFGYLRWELTRGWNNENKTSFAYALSDVYAWSLWRIGLGKAPFTYVIYLTDKLNLEMSKLPPIKG